MDLEMQKIVKLKNLEQNLISLLDKIDNEIIQTDVEWMQLKSMVRGQDTSKDNLNTQSKPENVLRTETLDDKTMNTARMDLVLGNANLEDYMEFDSD